MLRPARPATIYNPYVVLNRSTHRPQMTAKWSVPSALCIKKSLGILDIQPLILFCTQDVFPLIKQTNSKYFNLLGLLCKVQKGNFCLKKYLFWWSSKQPETIKCGEIFGCYFRLKMLPGKRILSYKNTSFISVTFTEYFYQI